MITVMWLGCGKIGKACIPVLQSKGMSVVAVSRSMPTDVMGCRWLALDLAQSGSIEQLPKDVSVIIYTPSPKRHDLMSYQHMYPEVLSRLMQHFNGASMLKRFILVSSTRVYGERAGSWVDERTPIVPQDKAAAAIYQAETLLHQARPMTATTLRLAGIYGPGREAVLRRLVSNTGYQSTPPYYTNRIHQRDVVTLLCLFVEKTLEQVPLESLYLGVDTEPVEQLEMAAWLSQRMGLPAPTAIEPQAPVLQNKRCRNLGLQRLAYEYHYPTFRAGYPELIKMFQQAQSCRDDRWVNKE